MSGRRDRDPPLGYQARALSRSAYVSTASRCSRRRNRITTLCARSSTSGQGRQPRQRLSEGLSPPLTPAEQAARCNFPALAWLDATLAKLPPSSRTFSHSCRSMWRPSLARYARAPRIEAECKDRIDGVARRRIAPRHRLADRVADDARGSKLLGLPALSAADRSAARAGDR